MRNNNDHNNHNDDPLFDPSPNRHDATPTPPATTIAAPLSHHTNNHSSHLMASLLGQGTTTTTSTTTTPTATATSNLFGDDDDDMDDDEPLFGSHSATTTEPNTTAHHEEDLLPFATNPPPLASDTTTNTTTTTATTTIRDETHTTGLYHTSAVAAANNHPSNTTNPTSLLLQSGLLGATVLPTSPATADFHGITTSDRPGGGAATTTTITSAGGGLFDEIDQEQAQAEALQRQQQQQQQRDEARRKEQQAQEATAAAAQRTLEDLQRRQLEQIMQQQQQQQQLTDQMQSVYLGNAAQPQSLSPPRNHVMAHSMPPSYVNTNTVASPPTPTQQQPQQRQANFTTHSPYGQVVPASNTNTTSIIPAVVTSGPSYGGQQSPPLQQQQQQQIYGGPVQPGFYREQPATQQSQPALQPTTTTPTTPSVQRYYQPHQSPSVLAGMHNGPQMAASLGRPPPSVPVTPPPPVPTFYLKVHVSEPLLIPGQALFGSSPHWSYQIATTLKPPPGQTPQPQQQPSQPSRNVGMVWYVRRRFRHVVALEDRLREECPGAVLPPRPDKHAARALEEASTQQSAEFAVQRANELQVYLNQLIMHPIVFATHTLRLFLSLQDDLGTAWPEVSNNAFTRLANAGVGAAVKVSEQTQATKFPWQDPMGHIDDYGEEDAELMALANQEQVRMGAVLQGVPKLEGAITLIREGAELCGATGMELSRLAKEVETSDKELSYPIELVAGGMLRDGRRSKRMALELAAALETFMQQYKICRYEKMAFQDRRVALMRRHKERGRADQRAHQLLLQQQRQLYGGTAAPHNPYGSPYGALSQQQSPYGNYNNTNNVHMMQSQAIHADTLASEVVQECEEIGRRVKSEVNRVAWNRRQEWKAAVKLVASASLQAVSENVAIWESVRESFLQAYPEE